MRNRVWRGWRVGLLAATSCLVLGSLAWGQYGRYDSDDSYNRHDDTREYGQRNGYRDGSRRGQADADRGRRFNFKNDDWEDSRGYERWMGDKGRYKHEYREGYARGYRQAYNSYGYRGRDHDWR